MEGGAGAPTPEGWLALRVHVPELNLHKDLHFPRDQLVWDVKQQCLAALPKELKESFNYGLFCPPVNGKAGKFLDEERRLGDYPFNGSVGYLELKYKRRVYKMLKLDEKQLKAVHTKTNLRRFIDYVNHGQVEKITKMCGKGLDPNFHCQDTGETPLTMAGAQKKPAKVLIALVNGGALLDYRTKDGSTAMHRAVEKNSLDSVKTLLELGASPNYKDGKGLTPLYLSVTNKTDPLLCESLLHDHATIGAQDLQGWAEVHQACRNGLIQHLDHLLFYGADMNGRNASGNTPLHVCAVNGQDSCARQLLFRGCEREALNFANQTAYQVAVIAGNMELAEVIKNYKPDDVVPFRGPPRYNPKRRSGAGWGWGLPGDRSSMASGASLPRGPLDMLRAGSSSPCPSDRPFSSASSSLSDGSHPSHDDNASIVTVVGFSLSDKSLGDASDIISDSSGVGTANSDTTTSSLALPGATVVCLENYDSAISGHLRISQGDIIEVTGTTDCGLLEGMVRGAGRSSQCGLFPPHCVQEVRLRQAPPNMPLAAFNSNTISGSRMHGRREHNKTYSATAPRLKKTVNNMEYRTVVLHRATRGFGFVLRGAKASSPLMEITPSERCPALQYLDDVDQGGVADIAGLKKGDFLVAINGEDVSSASHEHVVDLIRNSGSLVSMTVISVNAGGGGGVPSSRSVAQLSQPQVQAARQYATLPRKAAGGGGRSPAPAPPRRDPRTTLSVGKARAKSMVAGLENGGEKDDCSDQLGTAKSSSAESIHQHLLEGGAGGGSGGGTPCAPRTASIRARPQVTRNTAMELEEMFQRQQRHNSQGYGNNTMMTTSAFQDGLTSPQHSPAKITSARVYASVAEMKRSKVKNMNRGRFTGPRIPGMGELRRDFHSTPDLFVCRPPTVPLSAPNKGSRSQEDVNALIYSQTLSRSGGLPPPSHPPPPPPTTGGQMIAVDVGSASDQTTTTTITDSIAVQPEAVMSSFRPADSAKLYASPQDVNSVAFRSRTLPSKTQVRKSQSLRAGSGSTFQPNTPMAADDPCNQYAQPFKPLRSNSSVGNKKMFINRQNSTGSGPPPIPEPDYSMSESEDERDGQRLAKEMEIEEVCTSISAIHIVTETSANSNASGSSSGSGSMHHSFSVDEIQKIRTQLKSSKSYPNDFLKKGGGREEHHPEHADAEGSNDDGDNSSSGVSSDQELTMGPPEEPEQKKVVKLPPENKKYSNEHSIKVNPDKIQFREKPIKESKQCDVVIKNTREKVSFSNNVMIKSSNNVITTEPVHLNSSSENITTSPPNYSSKGSSVSHSGYNSTTYSMVSTPSGTIKVLNTNPLPPTSTLQRHNSLTRKQAASYMLKRDTKVGQSAAERLGVNVSKAPMGRKDQGGAESNGKGALTRNAVSLAQLPPPPEEGGDLFVPSPMQYDASGPLTAAEDVPPLAPPPQFSDRVRIVGALPKQNSRLHSQ